MSQFNWGDSVRINANAPKEYKPGATASICGIRIIDSSKEADVLNISIGSIVYLVEFGDGSSIEIPARYVESIKAEF